MDKELKIKISIDKNTGAVKVIGSEIDALNGKVSRTIKSASSLEKTFLKYASIGTVIYGVKQAFDVAYSSVQKFVDTADDMTLLNSRLSLVTESTQEYTRAQNELLRSSNNARVSISGTTNLYTQLSRSTKELKTSQDDLLQITDTVAKTLTISGASATAADAALLQLTQGIASGTLRGEELNSVLEQTPRLAQAIADGMGVSIGQLKQMGAQGELTAEAVLNALKSQAEIVNQEFSKIAINASSGYTVLNNTIDTTISKIDAQYKATQTVGQVYIAFGQTIDTIFAQMSLGWDDSNENALLFAQTTSIAVVNFIEGLGYAYDVLETLADEFNVVRYAGETAFWGIQVVTSTVADGIVSSFEGAFNFVIDGVNNIINGINSMGFISLPTIGYVDFGSAQTQARVDYVQTMFDEAYNNLQNSAVDFTQTGDGQSWASKIATIFEEKFNNLVTLSQNQENETTRVVSNTSISDTSLTDIPLPTTTDTVDTTLTDAVDTTDTSLDTLTDTLDTTNETITDTIDNIDTLNTSLGDDGTYTVVTNTTDAVDDLSDALDTVVSSAKDATEYIFSFSDTLLNSLSSNADTLYSVATDSFSIIEVSYQDALKSMLEAQAELISNPLDKDIADNYAAAFSQLQNSASDYLDINNFSSKSEYDFAVSTINTQLGQFQESAMAGYNVLESMNDFLEEINNAFADGILTEEEKATISGVADDVNAKNDILLGTSGAVVGTISSTEYYNNAGLATDSNISNQQYYNNAGLATDSNISNQQYYNNAGLATDISVNTVSSFIESLRGGQSSGIYLSGIIGSLPDLSVDTGLDVSDLTNLDDIATSTSATSTSTNNIDNNTKEYALDDTTIKTRSYGDQLRIGSVGYTGSQTTTYYDYEITPLPGSGVLKRQTVTRTPYNDNGVVRWDEKTDNDYYSVGGFTGNGYGTPDITGYKPAGIVHEDEWVAPKWMLTQNPSLFQNLEGIRQKGSFASGGYTSKGSNSVGIISDNQVLSVLRDMKQLGLTQTQQIIKLNKLLIKLSNGGEALLMEAV